MNQLSIRRLALNASLIIGALVTAITITIGIILKSPDRWLIAFAAGLAAAILNWFIFQYYIRNFIQNRIRTLYKTIYNIKDNPSGELLESDDLMLQMEREVTDWMKNRSTEIEDLKKLEHYRREFLGNVSHELKTPIFNIQGYITTLLDGGLEDETINRNYLQRAEKSVERMISIVEDLESISRLESGEMVLEKENFDIVELMNDMMYGQEMKASERKINLHFKENYKPMRVNADKDRIRQVATNLIVNSLKYGKDGGETEIRFYDMDDNILVEISDNGIGIAKEHLSRLFERFYRVDKGRSRDQGGTGLGLAIVKHILEAHGQAINVRSSEGVGSTFSFTLPKAK
ncbi:MAG: ATP-binding protein [Bacteroidetes bacterium]|nr:ATP-binding protein [Bacteroidota bacterium]